MKRLRGIDIRKALELELTPNAIFQPSTKNEGDIAAKEIYEEKIEKSSQLYNKEEIFKDDYILIYDEFKEEVELNENLTCFIYDSYICSLEDGDLSKDSVIEKEKTQEIIFLNTKVLNYNEFLKNIMDAHSFLGNFDKSFMKRKFIGIGSFDMEDYVLNHNMISISDIHFLDFFIKDSNLISSISMILTANYESDIVEQKEYFEEEEYQKMLENVRKHKFHFLRELNLNLPR